MIVPYKMFLSSKPIDQQLKTVWLNTLQPYLKSGQMDNNGTYDGIQGVTEPYGVMKCPSFNEAQLAMGMDQADCDGDGTAGSASTGWLPPTGGYYLAHYGAAFHLDCSTAAACDCEGIVRDGTQANPFFNFVGPYYDYDATCSNLVFYTVSFADVVAPARTVYIGDDFTIVRKTSALRISTALGCEAQFGPHQGGANYVFMDGHAKYLKGNSERYECQSKGLWYEKYYSYNIDCN